MTKRGLLPWCRARQLLQGPTSYWKGPGAGPRLAGAGGEAAGACGGWRSRMPVHCADKLSANSPRYEQIDVRLIG